MAIAFEWICRNWPEILGALTGLFYVIFSIRRKILAWPLSILSSLFYVYVFFKSAIFANMCLQGYFLVMGIYGWYYWKSGDNNGDKGEILIKKANAGILRILVVLAIILSVGLYFLLKLTSSPVPLADGFTTALSFIGTWMLARKLLENWLVWILVNFVSVCMYLNQTLWLTACLYGIYLIMAIIGFREWKKNLTTE